MTQQKIDTLIIGSSILTMDEAFTIIQDGAIAIHNTEIIAIGKSADLQAQYTADETIHCPDQVIMPGLVNAHTHIPMTLLRGLNDDLRLDVWLGYLMAVEREFVDEEFVKLGTKLGCAEMIQSGITSFADMYYFEDKIAEQTAEIGMRGLLGQTAIMFPTPDSATQAEALERCRRYAAEWQGHPLIQPAICPHAWYTSTPEQLAECAKLAQELDIPLHTHISETAFEVDNCKHQHGMTVVEWVGQHGLLDTKLLAAHCVHINRNEMDMLAAANAGIAHNPTSNLKLSSGIAPVAEMLEAGCTVGIGTDGTASNNDLDMFEEMRLAALVAKVKRGDPVDLPAKEALRLATIGGANAIHLGHLTGSLEVGKRADLIVLNMDGVHNWPHFNSHDESIYSRIVYASKSTDVAHTMCNGRWLMRDRQLLTVDLPQAQQEAAEVAKKIDEFVQWRESNPHNKLAALAGPAEQASYEAQLKIRLTPAQVDHIHQELTQLSGSSAQSHEHHDTYFLLTGTDGEPHYLRIREETAVQEGDQEQVTVHLTLLGEDELTNYDVTISRAQHHGTADRPLRFYREYFEPPKEAIVQKARQQWELHYNGVDFTINLDELARPLNPEQEQEGIHFLEIKSATESALDAETKAQLIQQLMSEIAKSGGDSGLARYIDPLINTN